MNYNQTSGCPVRMPGIMPPQCPPRQMQRQDFGPGPAMTMQMQTSRFPVGMGYVPWQAWETPYPMEQGLRRGTIFPSLDYPFMMGGCRR